MELDYQEITPIPFPEGSGGNQVPIQKEVKEVKHLEHIIKQKDEEIHRLRMQLEESRREIDLLRRQIGSPGSFQPKRMEPGPQNPATSQSPEKVLYPQY